MEFELHISEESIKRNSGEYVIYTQVYQNIFRNIPNFILRDKEIEGPTKIIKCVIHNMPDYRAQKVPNTNLTNEGVFMLNKLFKSTPDSFYPVLHFSTLDMFDEQVSHTFNGIPRFVNILDCSIWSYYICLENVNFKSLLRKALTKIAINYRNCIYSLVIANEYANLNYRLAKESFIQHASSKGHHGISPFLFHSETRMEVERLSLVKSIKATFKENMPKWRILFVDDHFIEKMGSIEDSCHITKKQIVENELKLIAKELGHDYNSVFQLDGVVTINAAIEKIKNSRYDIILLDYLLGGNGEKEYGYTLLQTISNEIETKDIETEEQKKKREVWQKAKGLFGRFWFMFASGFPFAVQERILSSGFNHSDHNWYIGRTACPTTTPELFKYNLVSLMKRQLGYITDIKMNIDKDKDTKVITLLDLLKYIYEDKKETRSRSVKNFNALLHLRAHYDLLKKDYYYDFKGDNAQKAYDNGSLLVQTLFPDVADYSNSFWEHIQHLVYLTAFGTILQWPEMWEEYIFIKDRLNNAEKKIFNEHTVSEFIKDYILSVKNK